MPDLGRGLHTFLTTTAWDPPLPGYDPGTEWAQGLVGGGDESNLHSRARPSRVPALPRNLQGGTRACRAGIGNKAPRQARPGSGWSEPRPVSLTWTPKPSALLGVSTLSRDGAAPQKGAPSRTREPATPGNARANSQVGRGELTANASPRPSAPRRHRLGGVANPGSQSPQRASPPPQSPSPPLQGPSSPRNSRVSPSPTRIPLVLGRLTGQQQQ